MEPMEEPTPTPEESVEESGADQTALLAETSQMTAQYLQSVDYRLERLEGHSVSLVALVALLIGVILGIAVSKKISALWG